MAKQALELYKAATNRGSPNISIASIRLANCLIAQKKYDEADLVLSDAFKDSSEIQGASHWRTTALEKKLLELHQIWTPAS